MLLVRSATILTMNDALDIIEGDVLVQDGRIVGIGRGLDAPGGKVIDAGGDFLLPGFIQTHVHLCQTLFRGYADDMALLEWLKTRGPGYAEALKDGSVIRVAVNEEYVPFDHPVRAEDEVAIFPPVTGGGAR